MDRDPSLTPDNQAILAPNSIVAGRYRVLSVLGKGGMGVVYRVEQIHLGKEFALKTILRNSVSDINIRRFQSEARANFAVSHPNIISIHDFGLLDDQTPFLVMELLAGETLAEKLKQQVLPVEKALPVFAQICAGVGAAHAHDVIHRDIKPGNIMLSENQFGDTGYGVKILDFGIAKLGQHAEGEIQSLTRTGEIFGSPLYMSPEQCNGGAIDTRTDIYSIGCVFFESLTGTPPFVGENALTTMMMHQTTSVPTLKEASLGTDYPKELELVIHKMLEKEPAQRYQRIEDALRHLLLLQDATGDGALLVASELASGHKSDKKSAVISMGVGKFALLLVALVALSSLTGFASASSFAKVVATVFPADRVATTPVTSSPLGNAKEDTTSLQKCIDAKSTNLTVVGDITDTDMQKLKGYKYAQVVSLVDTKVSDAGIAYLTDADVIDLNLDHTKVASVDNIVRLPHLQTLILNSTEVKDSDMAKLAKLKSLQKLEIINCPVTETGLNALLQSQSLESIFIDPSRFSPVFLSDIHNKFVNCGVGDKSSRSKFAEVKSQLEGQSSDKVLAVLLPLARQGVADHSILGFVYSDAGGYHKQAGRYAEAAAEYKKAEGVFERNHNESGLMQILMQEAALEAKLNRCHEYDALVGRCSKFLFANLRHDHQDTWEYVKTLVDRPAGCIDLRNTLDVCAKSTDILMVEANSRIANKQYFAEQAAWHAFEMQAWQKGLPYAKANYELCHNASDENKMAKSSIIYGHFSPDDQRKRLYDEGMSRIETMNFPDVENLREHYCDAASSMTVICDKQKKYNDALEYARKALIGAEKITNDAGKRKKYFAGILAEHLEQCKKPEEARNVREKYSIKSTQS